LSKRWDSQFFLRRLFEQQAWSVDPSEGDTGQKQQEAYYMRSRATKEYYLESLVFH